MPSRTLVDTLDRISAIEYMANRIECTPGTVPVFTTHRKLNLAKKTTEPRTITMGRVTEIRGTTKGVPSRLGYVWIRRTSIYA